MQTLKAYSAPIEPRGPWIPTSELRTNLFVARHAESADEALLVVYPGGATNDVLRKQLLLHYNLAASGAGFARIIDVFPHRDELVAIVELTSPLLFSSTLPLGSRGVARIGADVAKAVARLHEQGVVHGSLWTGSVVGGSQGASLLDLGWCAPIGTALDATTDVPNLAPENRLGQPVTTATDVWGIGALCYSVATNRYWDGPYPQSFVGVEPKLAAVIERCLADEPVNRFASVLEVAAALEAVSTAAIPASAQPTTSRDTGLTFAAAFGEHTNWFIEDGQELSEDQCISMYGFQPPTSRAVRVLVYLAMTAIVLAATFAIFAVGVEAL